MRYNIFVTAVRRPSVSLSWFHASKICHGNGVVGRRLALRRFNASVSARYNLHDKR